MKSSKNFSYERTFSRPVRIKSLKFQMNEIKQKCFVLFFQNLLLIFEVKSKIQIFG